MRNRKIVMIFDAEIDDDFSDQDMADVFNQVLGNVHETLITNLLVYEQEEDQSLIDLLELVHDEEEKRKDREYYENLKQAYEQENKNLDPDDPWLN